MKRFTLPVATFVFLALSACAPPENPAPPTPPKESTPEVSVDSTAAEAPASTVLSMHYMDAAAALAEDNLEKAKVALEALANESTGEMKTLAQAAANTGDIAATRERFKSLSELATKMELPKDYAVALCPMYKGGSKWVQKKGTLANPYFGKTMLTCGSFEKS